MDHYVSIYGYLAGMPAPVLVGAIQHPNPTHIDVQRALSHHRAHPALPAGTQFRACIEQDVAPKYVDLPMYMEYSDGSTRPSPTG